MKKIFNKLIYFSIFILFFSCNEFQKLLRNEDIKVKYEMAEKYYENEEWRRASTLFEQIQPQYRGKPQGERITFFYANSLLNRNNYVLAAFQFESFVKSYPISQKVEEAAFLAAYCYYKQSPRHSLDQDETRTAIEKLQNFINFYPFSEKLAEANDLIQELNTKLEYKAFEIAKQYNTIRDYTSAIKVLNSFISDYPGTSFREDALFYLFDSSYQLAINSIPAKRLERLNNAVKVYDREKIDSQSDNIYKAISIISKRTVQINEDIKKELISKLEEFATPSENLEEIFENKEQIEVSKFYEKLPKAHAIAIDNWLTEKIYHRKPEQEK